MALPAVNIRTVNIYVRVSTEYQEMATQLGLCQNHANTIVNTGTYVFGQVFSDKHSASGPNGTNRPAWNTLKETLNAGDLLIIFRVDRAGRSLQTIVDLDTMLIKNIAVYFIEYSGYYADNRELTFQLLRQAIAETSAMSDRATAYALHQRQSGGYLGRVPFGFRAQMEDNVRQLMPVQEIHQIVKEAVDESILMQRMQTMLIGAESLDRDTILHNVSQHLAQHRHTNISKRAIMRILTHTQGECVVCMTTTDDVIVCSGCFSKVHWYCVSPHHNMPVGDWYCAECVVAGTMPNLACYLCTTKTSTRRNPIMVCSQCTLGFHSVCIDQQNTDDDAWLCPFCVHAS